MSCNEKEETNNIYREREVNISKNWQIQVKLNKKSSNLNFILFDANSKWIINSKHAKGWKIKTYKSEFMSTTCLRLIADKHSNLFYILYIYIYCWKGLIGKLSQQLQVVGMYIGKVNNLSRKRKLACIYIYIYIVIDSWKEF